MVGFIWTIQLLVYPLMARVPAEGFVVFERFHQNRVVVVLALFSFAEVVSAAALVFSGVDRSLWLAGGLLLVALWVSTGAFYAPLHGRLAGGFDPNLHSLLVNTNWLRTIGWTARGVLALVVLVRAAN